MEGAEDKGIIGLMNSQVYVGVIYKVTRYKDEFGRDLLIPEVYIGQSSEVKSRWITELDRARRGEFGANNRYLPTLAKHFSKDATCTIDEAFDFEIIDLCYTQKELDLKETFYMDFYDSNNPDFGGLNYYRGPPSWGMTLKQVPMEELFRGLLSRRDFHGLEEDFEVSESTLRKKFGKFIRPLLDHIPDDIRLPRATIESLNEIRLKIAESSVGSLGSLDTRFALLVIYVAPILYKLISSGYSSSVIIKKLVDQGITLFRRYKISDIMVLSKICKDIWYMGFDACRNEFFIDPQLDKLKAQGIDFIIGEGREHIDPQDLLDLLDRRFQEKFIIGEHTQELGIIEYLIIAGLGWREISSVLNIKDRINDDGSVTKADQAIRTYILNRWGSEYAALTKIKKFLITHFLGSND